MRSHRRQQRGVTIVLVAGAIVALMTVAALAIDMGVLYTARTSAQHAADAAALAGAYTFLNPCNYPTGGAPPGACASSSTYATAATNAAIVVAAQNGILGKQVSINAGNVAVDEASHRVTVTVPRTGANGVRTYFAAVFRWSQVDVVARATAEAGTSGAGSRCLKPIFLPNTILSSLDPAVACGKQPPPPGTTVPPLQIVFDSQGKLTAWAKAKLGAQMNIRPISPGTALMPSQFYSLDFGTGAATYRCALGQCVNACGINSAIQCGASFPVETGKMVGPTQQGISALIGNPADTWVSLGQYRDASSGTLSASSRSLVVAPVWDDCNQTISPGYNGQKVKIVGFLETFIDGMQGQNVVAHVVNEIECAAQGGSGQPSTSGPFAVPVRLVQTPAS